MHNRVERICWSRRGEWLGGGLVRWHRNLLGSWSVGRALGCADVAPAADHLLKASEGLMKIGFESLAADLVLKQLPPVVEQL